MTLTEWLLAQIAADEAVAISALERHGARWTPRVEGRGQEGMVEGETSANAQVGLDLWDSEGALFTTYAAAEHIALHNPARTLAECQAKRAIVGIAVTLDDSYSLDAYPSGGKILRLLALPYADRPGYLEWQPE